MFRFETTREFLHAQQTDSLLDWEDRYKMFGDGDLSKARTMALLDPSYYDEQGDEPKSWIRLKRDFSQLDPALTTCESERIWGYACNLSIVKLHNDHLFPYTFGGVTHPLNRLSLCDLHNRLKTCDVHLYPWENPLPGWVRVALSEIAARRLALRAQ